MSIQPFSPDTKFDGLTNESKNLNLSQLIRKIATKLAVLQRKLPGIIRH